MLHHKQLQFKIKICICGEKLAFKTVFTAARPPLALTLSGSWRKNSSVGGALRKCCIHLVSVKWRKSKEYEVKKSFKMKVLFTMDLVCNRATRIRHWSVCWMARLTGRRFSGAQPRLRILMGRQQPPVAIIRGASHGEAGAFPGEIRRWTFRVVRGGLRQVRGRAASFQVFWMLAKKKRPFTDSETMKECMLAIVDEVIQMKMKKLKRVYHQHFSKIMVWIWSVFARLLWMGLHQSRKTEWFGCTLVRCGTSDDVLALHCASDGVVRTMDSMMATINFIHSTSSLQHCLFRKQKKAERHLKHILDNNIMADVWFLSDIFKHLNDPNDGLQGRDKTVTDLLEQMRAFQVKPDICAF